MKDMSKNQLNSAYFKPMLKQFIDENRALYKDSGYPYGIFLPYVFPKYYSAPLKIFYIGRDTYYWISKNEMMQSYVNNELEDYFSKNSSIVDVDVSLSWGNSSGAFWSFVNKLHLYIRTGQIKNLNNLSEEDKSILQEVGYGNINCMELNKTLLENEGRPVDEFNFDKLYLLRTQSKRFDKISHIIKAYQPDVVMILNWDNDADYYLDEFDFQWQENLFVDSKQAVYLSKEVKTKVIWSSHPNRFKFLGENPESMVHQLGDLLLSFNS